MSLGIEINSSAVPGGRRRVQFTLAADNAYPTGGYPAPTAAQLGFGTGIDYLAITSITSAPIAAVSSFAYNKSTGKIQAVTPAGAEVANGTSLANVTVDGIAEGH